MQVNQNAVRRQFHAIQIIGYGVKANIAASHSSMKGNLRGSSGFDSPYPKKMWFLIVVFLWYHCDSWSPYRHQIWSWCYLWLELYRIPNWLIETVAVGVLSFHSVTVWGKTQGALLTDAFLHISLSFALTAYHCTRKRIGVTPNFSTKLM